MFPAIRGEGRMREKLPSEWLGNGSENVVRIIIPVFIIPETIWPKYYCGSLKRSINAQKKSVCILIISS